MSRAVVLVVYLIVGIVGCVMSVQMLVRIVLWIMPCVERVQNTCCFVYQMEKERVRRRTLIYPIMIINIPTAEVTHVDTIPYPASIVATAQVEIV